MFVSFEGVDGCGKSTQARLLVEALRDRSHEVVATREPGGTRLGERIRELLLGGGAVEPWAEAALFAAARAQLVAEVIEPALARGASVVCDRFLDSSLVYQGIARGLGLERVLALNEPGLAGLLPGRTFVLSVPVELALARRAGERPDRIEAEGAELARRVADGYAQLAARFPDRVVALDASVAPEQVAAQVRQLLGLTAAADRTRPSSP